MTARNWPGCRALLAAVIVGIVASSSTRQTSGKLGAPGAVVSGLEELLQAVAVLFATPEGSVPGRPLYGFRVLDVLDVPVGEMRAIFLRNARRALVLNEPRAVLEGVEVLAGDSAGQVRGRVLWRPATGGELASTNVKVTNGV